MMTDVNPQGVGANYNKEDFRQSQRNGWEVLNALRQRIKPGMNEKEGRDAYAAVLKDFGVEKNWHPPKIRFGPNSTKSFRELSDEDYRLKENDIYFLDVGPIINGYEADVGQTFILGDNINPLHSKIIADGEEIFKLTKTQFLERGLNGPELYTFADNEARKRGWMIVGEGANGHRIGDFPHHVFFKGNLRTFPDKIVPDLWILEIQLRSPDMKFGAFFEDVL